MARTYVNQVTCIACGTCYSTCPGVYEWDDDGCSFVKLPGGLKDSVEVPIGGKYVQ